MAFVVPLIAAYATVGTAIAAGTATFAAYAVAAGAAMSSLGMLTKNKTLTKIGSIVGLVGGVTGIATGFSSAASGAAGAATGEAAGEVAAEAAKDGASEALKSEFANSAVGETIGQVGGDAASQAGGQSLGSFGQAANTATDAGSALTLDPNGFGGSANLMDQYRLANPTGVVGSFQDGLVASNAAGADQMSRLAEAGSQIKDQTALDTILNKINGAGKWVTDNKELAMVGGQLGGQLLAGGVQSYQQGQQFDQQMNLLAQRRARLNQPVVLGIQPPQLKTFTPGG